MKVSTSFLPAEYLRQGSNIPSCDGVSLSLEMGAREFLILIALAIIERNVFKDQEIAGPVII